MSPAAGPLVELRAVTQRFAEGGRERTVLDRVELAIAPGERVALFGRSGSGKTTLLHLVAGLERPTAGEVRFEGRALGGLGEGELALLRRRRMGFVFQAFNLLPTLTAAENVRLPLELAGARDGDARAREAIAALGLADRAGAFPDLLSGGEQQRLAIARALVHRPALVLADEPTGNLDAETAESVLAHLDRSLREGGAALLMATHSREAARLADRVLALRAGVLAEAA